jgi:hypothetical protein
MKQNKAYYGYGLPVSRLFWVSSLAYPNLFGTKGYVVVVVVMDMKNHKAIPVFKQ